MNDQEYHLRHLGFCIRQAVKERVRLRAQWEARRREVGAAFEGCGRANAITCEIIGWTEFINDTVREVRAARKGAK